MTNWPWPLDGIQHWFEDLWNWISTAAYDAVKVVSSWIWDAISWLKDRITEIGAWIWDKIKPLLGPVADWVQKAANLVTGVFVDFVKDPIGFIARGVSFLSDIISRAWGDITKATSNLGASLSSALDVAKNTIISGINGIATTITSAVGNAVNVMSHMFNGAISTMAGWVGQVLEGLAKALGQALSAFVNFLLEKLSFIVQSIIHVVTVVKDAVIGLFETWAREIVAKVTQVFSPHSPDPQALEEAETAVKTVIQQLDKIANIPRHSLPPYEALLSAVAGVAARMFVLKLGVEAWASALEAGHPTKELNTYRMAAGLMGVLDMPAIIGPMMAEPVKQGLLIPWARYWASRYTPNIPGYADMIRIFVREGYLSEYQQEIPTGMIDYFKQLGYDEFWAKALWGAHWELPSTGQVFEMYHRGIITKEDMSAYLKTADILHVWRDRLIAISWNLPGRIDARWMAAWGEINADEYRDLLIKGGLDPAWADRVASATIKQQLEPEINKLRDNAKNDFIKGYIDENGLSSTLSALGLPDVYKNYHIQDAIEDRRRQHYDKMVDVYCDAFIAGVIKSEDELRTSLSNYIIDKEALDYKVEEVKTRLEMKLRKEEEEKKKKEEKHGAA